MDLNKQHSKDIEQEREGYAYILKREDSLNLSKNKCINECNSPVAQNKLRSYTVNEWMKYWYG